MLQILFAISLLILSIAIIGMKTIILTSWSVISIISLTILFAARFTNFISVDLNILSAIKYVIWLVREIFYSSIAVFIRIWQPELHIQSCFKLVDMQNTNQTMTDLAKVVYANSITLTPGTITVELYDSQLLIHALDINLIDDLADGVMRDKIKKFMT